MIKDTIQKDMVVAMKADLPQLSEAEIYQIVSEYKIGESDMKKAIEDLMSKYSDVADKKVLVDTIKKIYK